MTYGDTELPTPTYACTHLALSGCPLYQPDKRIRWVANHIARVPCQTRQRQRDRPFRFHTSICPCLERLARSRRRILYTAHCDVCPSGWSDKPCFLCFPTTWPCPWVRIASPIRKFHPVEIRFAPHTRYPTGSCQVAN